MDGPTESQSIKADLLALMARGRDALVAWMDGLTGEERSTASTEPGWDAKATLAHIAHWNLALLTALALQARGQAAPDQWADMDGQNTRLLQESAARTCAEVAAEAEGAYAALRGWVEHLSEAELAAADDFAWRRGWSLWQTFMGNTYFHYFDHLAGYYQAAGQTERAAVLRAEADAEYRTRDLHWD